MRTDHKYMSILVPPASVSKSFSYQYSISWNSLCVPYLLHTVCNLKEPLGQFRSCLRYQVENGGFLYTIGLQVFCVIFWVQSASHFHRYCHLHFYIHHHRRFLRHAIWHFVFGPSLSQLLLGFPHSYFTPVAITEAFLEIVHVSASNFRLTPNWFVSCPTDKRYRPILGTTFTSPNMLFIPFPTIVNVSYPAVYIVPFENVAVEWINLSLYV